MDERLERALAPVLRDLRVAGLAEPRIEDRDWTGEPGFPSVMVHGPGGGGTGVSVWAAAPIPVQVAEASDKVQEWLIEELWEQARPTNWPACPRHPETHPLTAIAEQGAAIWVCPTERLPVAPIGGLGTENVQPGGSR